LAGCVIGGIVGNLPMIIWYWTNSKNAPPQEGSLVFVGVAFGAVIFGLIGNAKAFRFARTVDAVPDANRAKHTAGLGQNGSLKCVNGGGGYPAGIRSGNLRRAAWEPCQISLRND
jgi:hypothetical protein